MHTKGVGAEPRERQPSHSQPFILQPTHLLALGCPHKYVCLYQIHVQLVLLTGHYLQVRYTLYTNVVGPMCYICRCTYALFLFHSLFSNMPALPPLHPPLAHLPHPPLASPLLAGVPASSCLPRQPGRTFSRVCGPLQSSTANSVSPEPVARGYF